MARKRTYPTLYDECARFEIAYLHKHHCLDIPYRHRQHSMRWSCRGEQTSSINYTLDTIDGFVQLDYLYQGEQRSYRVELISKPSNLGIGKVWYFRCPQTGLLCRKLYLVGGWFLHRKAFTGCCYDQQTWSKNRRILDEIIYPREIDLFDKLKKCKETYRGRPTRRLLQLTDQLERATRRHNRAIRRYRTPRF